MEAILIRFRQSGEIEAVELLADSWEAEQRLKAQAGRIRKAFRPSLRIRLTRRLFRN
jgi:hypothetical protein